MLVLMRAYMTVFGILFPVFQLSVCKHTCRCVCMHVCKFALTETLCTQALVAHVYVCMCVCILVFKNT